MSNRTAHRIGRRGVVLAGALCLMASIGLTIHALGPGSRSVEAAPSPENGPYIELKYPRVIDGNSLDGYIDGKRVAVGLRGAEAPSLSAPCGKEAAARNRELAGTKVLLQDPPGGPESDQFGRRLYYVYTAEGRSVDEALARAGVARSRANSHYRTFMESVESEARGARRGCLWGG